MTTSCLHVLPLVIAIICMGAEPAPGAEKVDFISVLTLLPGGDDSVSGQAYFSARDEGKVLDYRLEVHGASDITMAHLHEGRVGDLSTPVVWLYPPSPPPILIPGEFSGVLAEGTITAEDLVGPWRGQPLSVLIEQMQAGNVFVNVHAHRHAAGEICGPITPPAREGLQ